MNKISTAILAALVAATPALPQTTKPTSQPSKPEKLALGAVIDAGIELKDLDGKSYTTADFKGRVTVVNFWSSRCPIQKGYDPVLAKIEREFTQKGVTFLNIDSNASNGELVDKDLAEGQKPYQEIRKVLAERDLPYTVLVDADSAVADYFDAKTTPHIYVFDRDAKLVYRGLIDDNTNGKKSDEETTHHLREALGALVMKRDVAPNETKPHGCSIKRLKRAKAERTDG